MHPSIAAVAALWLLIAGLVSAVTPTVTPLQFDVKAVIRSRQFKFRKGPSSALVGKRAELDDTCPPAPLPTVACKRCTTCTDRSPYYCASPNNDAQACGVCDGDKVVCPATDAQVATCTDGACSAECDSSRGFTGPPNNCADTSHASHVRCSSQPPRSGYALSSVSYGESIADGIAQGQSTLFCNYRKLRADGIFTSSVIGCHFDAETGIWVSENMDGYLVPVRRDCPASIETASTTGSMCYGSRACAQTLTVDAKTFPLWQSASTLRYGSPGKNDGGQLGCYWNTSRAPITCAYRQSDGSVISGSSSVPGTSVNAARCPPLRKEYTAYCLLG